MLGETAEATQTVVQVTQMSLAATAAARFVGTPRCAIRVDRQAAGECRGLGRVHVDGESSAERPHRRHRAQLCLALLTTANDGDGPRIGKREMFRCQRGDRGRAKAGQRTRIHDGQRPAVVAVEQDERSLNGRTAMPDRIAWQVHVGFDGHEDRPSSSIAASLAWKLPPGSVKPLEAGPRLFPAS